MMIFLIPSTCIFFIMFFFVFFFGFFQSFVVVVNLFIYLFIYFWLCWVFVSVRGLSLVVASGDHSSSRCADLSLLRPLLLRSTGSRRAASVVAAHGSSCSATCGIFPDQSSNPCPLHWQADSQPLHHQESPLPHVFFFFFLPHVLIGILFGTASPSLSLLNHSFILSVWTHGYLFCFLGYNPVLSFILLLRLLQF